MTLSVFVPFAVNYMGEPLKLDYLWAGLCMVGAVYFIFRSACAPACHYRWCAAVTLRWIFQCHRIDMYPLWSA